MTVLFDLIETMTHAAMLSFHYDHPDIRYQDHSPSLSSSTLEYSMVLSIASMATRLKYLLLNASLLLDLVGMIRQWWWGPQQESLNDHATNSSTTLNLDPSSTDAAVIKPKTS
jgi:hypothetical protein